MQSGPGTWPTQRGERCCVEVADTTDNGRAVRDSKHPTGPLLTVSREGWQAFVRQFC
ncbi:DUF397 domain-containing protein [Streptomyces sp. B21-108]